MLELEKRQGGARLGWPFQCLHLLVPACLCWPSLRQSAPVPTCLPTDLCCSTLCP